MDKTIKNEGPAMTGAQTKNGALEASKNNKSQIVVEVLKKTKKNEPKMFPQLMLVDKEAFETVPGSEDDQNTRKIVKEFWRSKNTKILVAKK